MQKQIWVLTRTRPRASSLSMQHPRAFELPKLHKQRQSFFFPGEKQFQGFCSVPGRISSKTPGLAALALAIPVTDVTSDQ